MDAIKNIHRDQSFSWTINSNRTETNPGIKKDHCPIKTIFTTKSRTKDHLSYSKSPEEEKV